MHIFGAHLQMSDQHCSVKTEIATMGTLCVCGGDTMGRMTSGHLECSSTFCEVSMHLTNMAVTRFGSTYVLTVGTHLYSRRA